MTTCQPSFQGIIEISLVSSAVARICVFIGIFNNLKVNYPSGAENYIHRLYCCQNFVEFRPFFYSISRKWPKLVRSHLHCPVMCIDHYHFSSQIFFYFSMKMKNFFIQKNMENSSNNGQKISYTFQLSLHMKNLIFSQNFRTFTTTVVCTCQQTHRANFQLRKE